VQPANSLKSTHAVTQRIKSATKENTMKLNDTTRTYPRTMQEAYPNTVDAIASRQRWEWMEGHQSDEAAQAEYWVHIACAFAAGFLVCHLFA